MAGGPPKRQFSRPSISLNPEVKKDWQEVEIQVLVRGDTVQGLGTIEWIEIEESGSLITWANGTQSSHPCDQKVMAFTAVV